MPPGPDDEDAALLLRMAAGETDAPVLALYRRFGRRVFAVGYRMLGDRGQAEDLVQETFVRVWRSAGRFDPARGSAGTFVLAIAKRAAIDALRRRSSRPTLTALEDDPVDAATDAEADRVLAGVEVREALAELPPNHREVLGLAYLGQLTQSEIATHLNIPLGTVKARTFQALKSMRRLLEERELVG